MTYWLKELFTKMFNFSALFSLTMYETIYSLVDKLFVGHKPISDIHTREDIFKETDNEDKKDIITVIIMLAILIGMIILIIKADIYVTKWKIAQIEADTTYFLACHTGGFIMRAFRVILAFVYSVTKLLSEFIAFL